MYLPTDIWCYLKEFMFHNIKKHGKHLKKDKNIENYNSSIKIFKTILKPNQTPKIIYSSTKNKLKYVKFIYILQHLNIRRLVTIKRLFTEDPNKLINKGSFIDEYYSELEN